MVAVTNDAIQKNRVRNYERYRTNIDSSASHIACPSCGKKVVPRADGTPRSHYKDVNKKTRCIKNPRRA